MHHHIEIDPLRGFRTCATGEGARFAWSSDQIFSRSMNCEQTELRRAIQEFPEASFGNKDDPRLPRRPIHRGKLSA